MLYSTASTNNTSRLLLLLLLLLLFCTSISPPSSIDATAIPSSANIKYSSLFRFGALTSMDNYANTSSSSSNSFSAFANSRT
ncbi:hypothetical protein MKX03_005634, partial [Papaver bracteatum]